MPTISERDEILPMGMKPPKKFCADCAYCAQYTDLDVKIKDSRDWECTAELKPRFNLVTGDPITRYCVEVREGDECGPAGNLWKPVGGSEGPY